MLLADFCASSSLDEPDRLERYRGVVLQHGHAIASPDAYYDARREPRNRVRQDWLEIHHDNADVTTTSSRQQRRAPEPTDLLPWIARAIVPFRFDRRDLVLVEFYKDVVEPIPTAQRRGNSPRTRAVYEAGLENVRLLEVEGFSIVDTASCVRRVLVHPHTNGAWQMLNDLVA